MKSENSTLSLSLRSVQEQHQHQQQHHAPSPLSWSFSYVRAPYPKYSFVPNNPLPAPKVTTRRSGVSRRVATPGPGAYDPEPAAGKCRTDVRPVDSRHRRTPGGALPRPAVSDELAKQHRRNRRHVDRLIELSQTPHQLFMTEHDITVAPGDYRAMLSSELNFPSFDASLTLSGGLSNSCALRNMFSFSNAQRSEALRASRDRYDLERRLPDTAIEKIYAQPTRAGAMALGPARELCNESRTGPLLYADTVLAAGRSGAVDNNNGSNNDDTTEGRASNKRAISELGEDELMSRVFTRPNVVSEAEVRAAEARLEQEAGYVAFASSVISMARTLADRDRQRRQHPSVYGENATDHLY